MLTENKLLRFSVTRAENGLREGGENQYYFNLSTSE